MTRSWKDLFRVFGRREQRIPNSTVLPSLRPNARKPSGSRWAARRKYFVNLGFEQLETRIALTAYYISNSGSDANNGLSPGTAWQTFAAIERQNYLPSNQSYYQPGDQILFQGGQTFTGQLYFGSSFNWAGTEANPITIGSYGTGRATLKSTSSSGQPAVLTLYDLGGIKIQNLNVQGPGASSGSYFHGISFTDRGIVTSGRISGITIDQVDAGGFSGSGITFYSPNAGMVGYNDIRVTNATLHDCQAAGLTFTYRTTLGYYPFTNIYVGNITAYNNPGSAGQTDGYGLDIGGVSGAVIEKCVAYSNGGLSGNNTSGGAAGIGVVESSGVTVQYCEVYSTLTNVNDPNATLDGDGIDFDWGTQYSTMQFNYVHDNYGAGLADFGYIPAGIAAVNGNNIIRFNMAAKNGARNPYGEIDIYGAANHLDIYNNTAYAKDYGRGTNTAFLAVNDNVNPSYSNVRVFNNILLTQQNLPPLRVNAGANNVLPQFNGNDYWDYTGQFTFNVGGVNYNSLSAWQNATGMEKLNGTPTGSALDPKLVDAGFDGIYFSSGLTASTFASMTAYRLDSASPLRNTGIDLKNVFGINVGTSDFYSQPLATDPLGNPRTNLTGNPGADQFFNQWTIAGIGDFSDDGKADVLWENLASGVVGAWITGGGWLGLGTAPLNQGWTIAGVGDFGGDARTDILWQNTTTGQVGAWITGGGWLGLGTAPLNQGWTLAGVGDFGGDTKADILWQNTTTGQVGAWITGGGWLGLGTAPLNQGWTLAGVGDFGGDTKADILWQNTTSGQIGAWITGGGWLGLGTAPLNQGWTLAGVGDCGGDTKADILWQNTTSGQIGAWITGGGWLGLGTAPLNQGWTLAGVGDCGGDAKADVFWENLGTGVVGAWITGGSWLGLGAV